MVSPDAESLPPIPDKRYFTISEAAALCHLKPHVLRYWEKEFAALQQVQRRGNRRYYQYQDLLLLRTIKDLLHRQGFTLEGARNYLQQNTHIDSRVETKKLVHALTDDLEQILHMLDVS